MQMTTETVELSFGKLLKLSLDAKDNGIDPYVFTKHDAGVEVTLPVFEQAAIAGDDVSGTTREVIGAPTWLQRGQDAISRELRYVPVTEAKGNVPFGTELPQSAVVSEFGTSPFVQASGTQVSETAYLLRYIESRVSISTLAIIQSEADVLAALEGALQQASSSLLVEQLLTGPGGTIGDTAQYLGAEHLQLDAGNRATYVFTNGLSVDAILDAEDALLDNDASPANLVWAFGTSIHSELQRSILDPGSGERMLQRRRLFTGSTVVRAKALTPTTGILFDVREACAVPVSVENELFINRISKPGTIFLTLRTHLDVVWVRPKLVYRITAA